MGVTRRGFTLAEAVIAGGIVALMFMSTLAVLAAATRTVDPPAAVLSERSIRTFLEGIREEVASATSVAITSGTRLDITVPDRDADGSAESIVYDWHSGTKKLTRTIGAGPAQCIATSVSDCEIASFDESRQAGGSIVADTTEFALALSPDHPVAFEIGPTLLTGYALVIKPLLPSTATSWTITGLRLRGRQASAPSANITFELRGVSGGFPSSTVLASLSVRGSTFPASADWVKLDFADVTLPATTTSVGLTITTGSVLPPCALEAMVIAKATPWDSMFNGTLVLWTGLASNDLSYELLGKVSLPEPSLATLIGGVRITFTSDLVPGTEFSLWAPTNAIAGTASAAAGEKP